MAAMLALRNVTKRYDRTTRPAVKDLTIDIGQELFVLIGPSGCGKTTTLRLIAGLEPLTSGQIAFSDVIVNDLPPHRREIAYVTQEAVLYPQTSVRENLVIAAHSLRLSREELENRIADVTERLQIGALLERFPDELSGGERQRVALGRAFMRRPKILLLDEPLTNLDAVLRLQLRRLIRELFEQLNVPTIYVTHDQEEALALADRVAIMRDGQLLQCGTPTDVYRFPATRFVATITGHPPMNLIERRLLPKQLLQFVPDEIAHVGFRPEDGAITENSNDPSNDGVVRLSGIVSGVQFVGNSYLVSIALGAERKDEIILRCSAPPSGDLRSVDVEISRSALRLFNSNDRLVRDD